MHSYISITIDISLILFATLFTFATAYRKAILLENSKGLPVAPSYYSWWSSLLVFTSTLILCCPLFCGLSFYNKHKIYNYLNHQNSVIDLNNRMATAQEIISNSNLLSKFKQSNFTVNSTYNQLSNFYAVNNINLPIEGDNTIVKAAFYWQNLCKKASLFRFFVTIFSIVVSYIFAIRQIKVRFKVRHKIETLIQHILQLCAIVAIVTTCAIVLSLIFQTWHFFQDVSFGNFFFNTVWDPRFSDANSDSNVGQFGILPLILGTLYIALIAMIVATSIGLYSAIYMAEYAKPGVRSIIKLLLEILAGIPTIVYGFFALLIVGPFLRDLSSYLTGGEPFILAQSVLTAGLVIGIMLIPFVSSLTDNALKAVPKSLRDGSYGLGATKSETIKKVVLPAALPGIVGALLLSTSRAIGETMIVVLAAGVAPNLTLNPFHAMTTITVKIVSQLTGDTEFNSPQTLVAFALGMTLFIFTLLLNMLALYIVRKYREQYE